jgi:hypothetical protein
MSFQPAPEPLSCNDCAAPITLDQYRRKVPRCDDCEVRSAVRTFEYESAPIGIARVLPSGLRQGGPGWKLELRIPQVGIRLEWSVSRL